LDYNQTLFNQLLYFNLTNLHIHINIS
jgi:hypothetical protein